MKTPADFEIGQDVFIRGILCAGVVELKFSDYIIVRWEDGTSGLLFTDPRQLATLQRLEIGKRVELPL